MIVDIILFILTLFARLAVLLLSSIPFFIPDAWETAITHAFSYLGYFQGWLPLYPDPTKTGLWATVGLMTIMGWFIYAIVGVYMMKGVVMIFHLFTLGKIHLKLPTMGKGRNIHE